MALRHDAPVRPGRAGGGLRAALRPLAPRRAASPARASCPGPLLPWLEDAVLCVPRRSWRAMLLRGVRRRVCAHGGGKGARVLGNARLATAASDSGAGSRERGGVPSCPRLGRNIYIMPHRCRGRLPALRRVAKWARGRRTTAAMRPDAGKLAAHNKAALQLITVRHCAHCCLRSGSVSCEAGLGVVPACFGAAGDVCHSQLLLGLSGAVAVVQTVCVY